MDWAQKKNDEDLERLERRIRLIYTRALKEAKTKLKLFTADFYKKDKVKRQELALKKITKAQYDNWRRGQYFIQGRWQAMVDEIAEGLANADKMAMDLTSENMVKAYTRNYNYGLFDIDQKAKPNISFTVYNEKAVRWLIKDNPNLLPMPDPEKAKTYNKVWNTNRITEELTQSIIQGEDVHQLADRFERVIGMDRNAAIRNARTLSTEAENKARLDSLLEMESKGIPVFKQWVATEDERTRESHMKIHLQVRRPHEPFDNGLMYPGDISSGKPSEYYNCRCRLIGNPRGLNPAKSHDTNMKNMTGGRSFLQWLKEHILHG